MEEVEAPESDDDSDDEAPGVIRLRLPKEAVCGSIGASAGWRCKTCAGRPQPWR